VNVRQELIPALPPADVGWLAYEGTDDFKRLTAYDTTLRADARRYELVTLPFQDFAGMKALLGFAAVRLSLHLYNTPAQMERVEVLERASGEEE